MIGDLPKKQGCVHSPNGYVDVNILRTIIYSLESVYAILIGKQADLLILQFYHIKDNKFKLYSGSDVRRELTFNPMYNALNVRSSLGCKHCNLLLFLHTCTGTSRISWNVCLRSMLQQNIISNRHENDNSNEYIESDEYKSVIFVKITDIKRNISNNLYHFRYGLFIYVYCSTSKSVYCSNVFQMFLKI